MTYNWANNNGRHLNVPSKYHILLLDIAFTVWLHPNRRYLQFSAIECRINNRSLLMLLYLSGILVSSDRDAGKRGLSRLRIRLRSAFRDASFGIATNVSLSAFMYVSLVTIDGITWGSSMHLFFASANSFLALTFPKSGLCCAASEHLYLFCPHLF